MATRSYLVGLPVVITVDDDGRVTASVCAEEAGEAITESIEDGGDAAEITADAATVDHAYMAAEIVSLPTNRPTPWENLPAEVQAMPAMRAAYGKEARA